MDSRDIKQIVIAHRVMESALDAILKPIRIELGDSETVATMPKATYDTLHWMKIDCASIQRILARMDDYISVQEKSLGADEEIAKAVDMISGILFVVQPTKEIKVGKTNAVAVPPFDMEKHTEKVVMGEK